MKKQTKTIRVLAVLLVALLMLLAFAGCSSSKKDEDSTDETVQDGSSAYKQYMEWLKQYEKWVDSYINVCKNYNKNPTSYMNAYLTKTAELAEWTEKFSDIDDDGLTTAEAAKITNEYLKIYNKMIKAVSELN